MKHKLYLPINSVFYLWIVLQKIFLLQSWYNPNYLICHRLFSGDDTGRIIVHDFLSFDHPEPESSSSIAVQTSPEKCADTEVQTEDKSKSENENKSETETENAPHENWIV